MGLAQALQRWVADSVFDYLRDFMGVAGITNSTIIELFKPQSQGKPFLGAMRWQEVDVWVAQPEFGLALAADPKHFQSLDSLRKNWKNGHNDLIAFATNLHERFPMCVIAGVLVFPEWAAGPRELNQIEKICLRSIPREKALNAYGKFEAFAVVRYNQAGELNFPYDSLSPLAPGNVFRRLADTVVSRFVATFET